MANGEHHGNLQSTECQHNRDTNLTTGPQLETVQQRHRYNNSRNIGKDAQSCLCEVECWSVHTNSSRHFREDPTGRDWRTTEDVREDASERVADDEGEQRPYSDDDVSSGEDTQVEEQDASFGKAGSSAEHNCREKIPLSMEARSQRRAH